MPIYAVRTTAGQEKNVAKLVALRAQAANIPIKAIIAPETLKGYIFIEADGPHIVDEAISGIRHVRSRVSGVLSLADVERYIVTKPVIAELSVGDIVEVVGGPFRGMTAKITRVDLAKEEVTIELLEAAFTLPVTVHADYVRLVEKAGGESGRKESG